MADHLSTQESAALDYLAWAEKEAATIPGTAEARPRPVQRVSVIGAGTMGSAIAVSLANSGISVDLVEQTQAASDAGAKRVEDLYKRLVKSGRVSENEADVRKGLVNSTLDWAVVKDADLAIEAAFEDLGVKQSIFEKFDQFAKPGAVLATNTSYLDVNAIADATARPGDVLGLHFFSPAHIMRLVEVVRTDKTSPEVLATALELGRRIGKLPIVAGVCDGFIGNRIFSVYRRHAEYLLEDGASPYEIDDAVRAYGFAMGPFAVSDMSGLDIAWAMRKRKATTRNPNERYVGIPDILCEAGRLGRKAGKGWYDYVDGKPVPSTDVLQLINQEREQQRKTGRHFSSEEIQRRLFAVIVNEAARVLEEGISFRPSDIDLVFVNGYGFPKSKGGPLFAADVIGLQSILAEVEVAAGVGGAGSEPSTLLCRLAADGTTFQEWQKTH